MRHLALLVALALVVAGCGSEDPAPTSSTAPASSGTSTTVPNPSSTTSATAPQVPLELADFTVETISVGDEPLLVAVADTPDLRRQGLMFVTDLGDLDGMLFVFDRTAHWSFWMKNTLIPLDIAFFAEDGSLITVLQMEPCGEQDPCPSYGPEADSRYALEAPLGALAGLDPATRLER